MFWVKFENLNIVRIKTEKDEIDFAKLVLYHYDFINCNI
jgi:hypothetical protein